MVNSGKAKKLIPNPKTSSVGSATESASFRDNWGFVYKANGKIYRQINPSGQKAYDHLMSSGLYNALTKNGLLIAHKEAANANPNAYKIIEPALVPFISYPYEWCFSQVKNAALATLAIQKIALEHGMSLRDASAYNIQFVKGKPILIDTLSFDIYEVGAPWQAYRQFCQHFLAPLVLASYRDVRLMRLSELYIDGLPLDLTAKLLPARSLLKPSIALHIKAHARLQTSHGDNAQKTKRKLSLNSLKGLVDGLERMVASLSLDKSQTAWSDYYDKTNYANTSFKEKTTYVEKFISIAKPKRVLDLGGNNGVFSRLASTKGIFTISTDFDYEAIEQNYQTVRAKAETNLLPLVIDLTNPSPALGWNNQERSAFGARADSDLVMALALVHHLAIANNTPLDMIAKYFASLAKYAIVEFVPKSDSQVKRLLASREDIFDDYDKTGFEKAFNQYFEIKQQKNLKKSTRTLYLLKVKGS